MNTVSIQRPRPSMLIRTSASRNTLMKAWLVSWPLIGVEDLGPSKARQRSFQRRHAETRVHRVRAATDDVDARSELERRRAG